ALKRDEPSDPGLREAEKLVELRAPEGHLLGRPLHFHEGARPRHHHVHVNLGRGVLGIIEVERRLALHDAHADGGHAIAEDRGERNAGLAADGVRQRDEAACNGSGASTAIGLDHVAVDPHGALAELAAIDHGPERAAYQALDLLRAATWPTILTRRAGVGR